MSIFLFDALMDYSIGSFSYFFFGFILFCEEFDVFEVALYGRRQFYVHAELIEGFSVFEVGLQAEFSFYHFFVLADEWKIFE